MSKLIIGCGYLGRRVAERWRRRGERVAALTRSARRAEALRADGIEPIIGDVTEPETLGSLPPCETLLYAVGFDRRAGRSRHAVYVDGLENVLREVAPRTGRIVYTSSVSVYGQRDGGWVDESSPTQPARENGRVCLEAERTLWRYHRPDDAGPAASVLRLAGLYGPGRLLRRAESLRRREPIAGEPEAWLNLVHVEDAARAVLACQERGRPGSLYLVCDDRPVRRREYYERLAAVLDAPPPVFSESDEASGRTTGLNKRCSNRRMHAELGVSLVYPTIEEGLPAAIGGNE